MTNNPNVKSLFLEFRENGKTKILEIMLSKEKKPKSVFEFITKRDLQYGIDFHRTATILVVDYPKIKKTYLEKRKSIDLDFPILTLGEYKTFMKAWWKGYAEMSQNGRNRDAFNFALFIRSLYNKALDWDINQKISENIMVAFGLNKKGNFFKENYKWVPVLKTEIAKFNFEYTPYMCKRLKDGFWDFIKSSDFGIMQKIHDLWKKQQQRYKFA